MTLRTRLALLFVVLALLPTIPAALVTRDLLDQSVDIALRDDIDAALDAGVRQTRESLGVQRTQLRDLGAAWIEALDGGDVQTMPAPPTPPNVRVELIDGPTLVDGDAALDSLIAARSAAPRRPCCANARRPFC